MQLQPDRKVQKLNKRHLMRTDLEATDDSKRARKSASNAAQSNAIRSPSKLNYSGPIDACGNICEGLEFCILGVAANCANGTTVQQLIDLVRSHGGTVVANPTSATFVCIAPRTDRPSLRLSTMCAQRQHNIATVDWLLAALRSTTTGTAASTVPPPFRPADMLCITDALRAEFAGRNEDAGSDPTGSGRMGDDDTTLKRLRQILGSSDSSDRSQPSLSRTQQYGWEKELWAPAKSPNYFRTATAYFEGSDEADEWGRQSRFWFRWYGGRVLDDDMLRADPSLVRQLSHIFVADQCARNGDVGCFAVKRGWAATDELSAKMVRVDWVLECHRLGTKVSSQEWVVANRIG